MSLNPDALHRLLWESSGGPHHTVCVEQVRLAEDLLCSPSTLNRALRALVAAGRLDQLTTDLGPGARSYAVSDPTDCEGRRVARPRRGHRWSRAAQQ